MTMITTLVFAAAFALVVFAIGTTLTESWARVCEVMNGTRPSRLPELRAARPRHSATLRVALVRPRLRAAA